MFRQCRQLVRIQSASRAASAAFGLAEAAKSRDILRVVMLSGTTIRYLCSPVCRFDLHQQILTTNATLLSLLLEP